MMIGIQAIKMHFSNTRCFDALKCMDHEPNKGKNAKAQS
jgi:hypothetical protein